MCVCLGIHIRSFVQSVSQSVSHPSVIQSVRQIDRQIRKQGERGRSDCEGMDAITSVVVKIRVPFWVLNIIRHLIFMVPFLGP